MFKSKRGISITTMVVTVLVMVIIMGTLAYSAVDSVKVRQLNKFYSDIRQVSDAVEMFYLRNGELPVVKDEATKDIDYKNNCKITVTKGEDLNSYEDTDGNEIKYDFILKKGVTKLKEPDDDLVNPNDYNAKEENAVYVTISKKRLENLDLNRPNDVYIVNIYSHTVYNLTGYDGEHYLPIKYTNVGFYGKANQIGLFKTKNNFFNNEFYF